ncbi:hypothetical protein GLAREA_10114 [Glarea lozoyensis ATCC 20868]|uniref:Transcriptional regulator n=2 Tax=Glarea lozoyensis TaxID=101852 RepID=S3D9K5_GLAL2|nr:uncharacterized protein GLAREA_10114 [Glarea lozoyensis ATCC 20868]EHK97780.1 hypothetical protein M7I_6441 [Glarea lozoyensis 74030]EPE34420.1 hypothetical protein GLAREA_10114 [Glarea lozoyensis ATCC 20868]
MAPSSSALVAQLKKSVKHIFDTDREQLSVKKVRSAVEEELDLENGFFLSPEWKDKSKQIIKEHVEHLDTLEEAGALPVAEPTPEKKKKPAPVPRKVAPSKKRAQKPMSAEKARPAKRQKKQATPSDEDDVSASSILSDAPSDGSEDFGDSDASEAPKPKKKIARKSKTPVKKGGQKRKQDNSDEEEDDSESSLADSESDAPPTKKQPPVKKSKQKTKPTKSNAKVEESGAEEESSALTTPSDSESGPAKKPIPAPQSPKSAKKKQPTTKPTAEDSDDDTATKVEVAEKEEKANASDSSEMSVVIDEGPKPKRKRASKSAEPKSKSKSTDAKAKPSKPTEKTLSPAEEQIKTLQSHLLKCGVRKIWAFELKSYGEDNNAKIKHLKDMLRDVGMVGRFSESRAREIKEMRELQKDLEDVKEGEKNWGMESGRASRSKAVGKSLGKGESEEGGGDSEDEEEEVVSRPAKRAADLAFLGSESESD